jgi:ribosomal protein S18 acetylase RimI-like enzyme
VIVVSPSDCQIYMKISQATIDDAEEILSLQKLAYRIEAERYNDDTISPLKQTLNEIKDQFKDHIFLKAVSHDKIIGTVRASEENGTCYVGRLAVYPEAQNRGIGTALMKEIEKYYTPKRFELFVGSKSENNIHLYKKLGYRIFKTAKYECGNIEIYYMEKITGSV